jgi:hypothetical protein
MITKTSATITNVAANGMKIQQVPLKHQQFFTTSKCCSKQTAMNDNHHKQQ